MQQVAQGHYVVSDICCPALHDCELEGEESGQGTLFVCSSVCLSPQALSGLKYALSGLKSTLSDLKSALSGLESERADLGPEKSDFVRLSVPPGPLRPKICPLRFRA